MYFEQNSISIKETIDARKEKIDNEAAWNLIQNHKEVVVGKGKKVLTYTPDESVKDEILNAAMGRSGNLRAPAVVAGERMAIGYNDEIYQKL